MPRPFILLALLVILTTPPLFGWGEKGHYLVNDAATTALPTDMPHFFYRAFPQLVWLGFDPDRWKGGGESLNAVNDPDHFLDYEYTAGVELPRDRYEFIAAMEKSGAFRRQGLEVSDPGFLLWRIAEWSELLTTEFRMWRASRPGSPERAWIEADIIHIAGVLGHFAGDAAQPLHATMNYNGWVLPNPNGYANDCLIHARFETNFVSHSMELHHVVARVAAPVHYKDPFLAALEFIKASNKVVEPLYVLDRDGAFDTIGPPAPAGVEFAADRLAAGASFLRDLWWSAWRNSAERAPRRR